MISGKQKMKTLNKSQQQAVNKSEGPCIILAGAGTGKSFTVVEKINYLINIEKKYSPEDILCLTFSNEATASLSTKVSQRIGGISKVCIKTFHSFCADILREDGNLIGIDEGFQILLPDDAKILMFKYLGITPYWSNKYISSIHTAKDFGISLSDIKNYTETIFAELKELCPDEDIEDYYKEVDLEFKTLFLKAQTDKSEVKERKSEINEFVKLYKEYHKFKDFIDAWEKYNLFKKEKNYLDFSDLNQYVLELFKKFGSKKYVEQFKYVFVDEFQDTNMMQFELIEFIAKHHNITVVGDPNQSIYGFRGSYKESFNHFKKIFNVNDSTDLIKLDKTFRSPNNVLNVSYDLIKTNYENPLDCVFVHNADNIEGDKVLAVELVNHYEEARYIADLVEKKLKSVKPSEICILYRTHKQENVIRHALELKKIPLISAGKTNIMQRSEIKTVIAYLSILSNIYERTGTGDQSWWNLFHYQNSLSPEDSIKIGRYLKENKKDSIDELLLTAINKVDLSSEGKVIVKKVISKLKEVMAVKNKALPDLVLDIYEIIGLNRAFTFQRTVENVECLLNLKRFHEIAQNYYALHEKSLSKFIEYIEMIDELGVDISSSKAINVEAVKLMTIHASKGLEFDTVIVTNLAEDRFPVTRTTNEPLIPKELMPDFKSQIKDWKNENLSEKEITKKIKEYDKSIQLFEERRLCYVAFTRAKKNLVLTYATSYDNEPNSTKQSLFLDEIDYIKNKHIDFIKDLEEKSTIIAPNSEYEEYKSLLKKQLINSLDTEDFESISEKIMNYMVCRDKKITPFKIGTVNKEELNRHLLKCKENKSSIVFDPSKFTFSPSALIEYKECPKKFEIANILQMPERGEFDEGGTNTLTGLFIHKVFEEGVKKGFKTEQEYLNYSKELQNLPEWKNVDEDDSISLIKVFFQRNKGKYNNKSKTEIKLPLELGGFQFYGIADRIDILADGSIELIDYKTNKNAISPDKRAVQLGFYAIALKKMGYKISKVTLEMLRLDKPLTLVMHGDDAKSEGRSEGFNMQEVEQDLINTAKKISHDFEHDFKVTENDDHCKYCKYKFYCPKWVE